MAFFTSFTERVQRALMIAQAEASAAGRSFVGTEHLLLGIMHDPGAAGIILDSFSIDEVRQATYDLIGRGNEKVEPGKKMTYTPRTKQVLELSAREAMELKMNYVGTEHVLLALMREPECVAAHVLAGLGLNLQESREKLIKSLRESSQQKKVDTPKLNQYGTDLTERARNGELDPVIGRDKEIERIMQILSRRTKNNPVLIGEPGVGKSAIVDALAQRIVAGDVPDVIAGKRLVQLDIAAMVAGAKYRGEFEERIKAVAKELKDNHSVLLFIDELHQIVGAGSSDGATDAANMLKPLLSRGELQCIGATTLNEYRKYIEKDSALARRFQPVTVGEPTQEETLEMLFGLRDKYEAHHKVTITDDALHAAVSMSARYINDRFLPDKAIDLIDEAAAHVRIHSFTQPAELKECQSELDRLTTEKSEAINNQDFEKAAAMRDEEKRLHMQMEEVRREWEHNKQEHKEVVDSEEVARVVSAWTGIPLTRLSQSESARLLGLEGVLHERVIGQDEAVSATARAVRRARAGLKDPRRPVGSFIFMGPTGVGKTELCRALAEAMFGDEKAMIRLDMSEYMEKHTVSRMIGSPPGYVGYDEGGQLTERVRRKPYSVVLFDEIEKAHPDVLNLLLQIMEDGRLTDGQGRTVNFQNTVIIMTSNVGASAFGRQRTMGFGQDEGQARAAREEAIKALKATMRPEFINRVDEIIVFNELSRDDIDRIAELMIHQVSERLAERGIELELSAEAVHMLAEEGYDRQYGARPLRRTIQRAVEDALSEEILSGDIKLGDKVRGQVVDGKLCFERCPVEMAVV
ncbi:MAG TPA: ATP-dependent Clp protease ATP-binding subunit [Candidatus Fimadaptatus faecigallinarum]|uniref:ATP-dependent Clp protease ATP-binding subunit n=1 Tax=Candidatus Fimadaptatus faecigallinarum TaxID=2840814 RepID=A0A9D1S5P6_9FIRM|nr:ATP-dependent Clp protease ATP-binding subunit [Candidatus Fimadaptatus faecigallinarum]